MKNVEMVSKAIEKILTKPVVNWYRVTELSEEQYEIKFYINFYIDDENEMKVFEEDIKELVKVIENNTLMKIEDKYYIMLINDVDVIESSILQITVSCEKIKKIQKII